MKLVVNPPSNTTTSLGKPVQISVVPAILEAAAIGAPGGSMSDERREATGEVPSAIGRYQISTCLKRDWVYVYVIDTATGVVKFVDEKNENKPFDEIKSMR